MNPDYPVSKTGVLPLHYPSVPLARLRLDRNDLSLALVLDRYVTPNLLRLHQEDPLSIFSNRRLCAFVLSQEVPKLLALCVERFPRVSTCTHF